MKRITSNILRTNPEAAESLPGFILTVDNYPTLDRDALDLAESLGFTQIGEGRFVGVDNTLAEYTFERWEPLPAVRLSDLTVGTSFVFPNDLTTVYEYQGFPGRVKNYMAESAGTYIETDINLEVNPNV